MEKHALISKLYWLIQKAEFEDDVNRVDDSLKEEASPLKKKTELQYRILEGLEAFGKAMEEEIEKEQVIQEFLKGYYRLALLSKSYTNEDTSDLFDLAIKIWEKDDRVDKSFDLGDRFVIKENNVIIIKDKKHDL